MQNRGLGDLDGVGSFRCWNPSYFSNRAPQVRRQKPGVNTQFRGGLIFKALRLCVSLNSRLESDKEEEEEEEEDQKC